MKLKLIALAIIISLGLLAYSQRPIKPKPEPMCDKEQTNAPCYVILHAVATDNKGAQTVSAPVKIHILPR